MSCLKKCVGEGVVAHNQLPTVQEDGQLLVKPMTILDRKVVKKHNQPVTQVLIHWSNSFLEDATWEDQYGIQQSSPNFQP